MRQNWPLKERQNITPFFSWSKIFSLKSIGGTHFLFGNLANGHFSGHTGSNDTDFKVGVVSRSRVNEESHRQMVKKIKDIII